MRVQSIESVEKVDSVIVEQRDTLREVTTITIDRNDKGDTLKVVQVTDRSSIRDRDRFKVQDSRLMIKTDTVYIEKRDSVFVQNSGLTNRTDKRASPLSYLKWICWILVAGIVLVVVLRFGRLLKC